MPLGVTLPLGSGELVQRPRTRYATSRTRDGQDVRIAWQQFGPTGDGVDRDLVIVHGFVSHVDVLWDGPGERAWMERLATFSRVTHFDKRGVGMSDQVDEPPTLEERVEDMLAVLDAAGVERATFLGGSEGVPMAILFAAAHPERVESLVLFGGMARTTEAPGYPFAPPAQALLDSAGELILPHWDEPVLVEVFAPSIVDDAEQVAEWQRYQQIAASPAMVLKLNAMAMDYDVRDLLPLITVPTFIGHRRGDRAVPVQGARWMAEQIPGCEYHEFEGIDHTPWAGDVAPIMDAIEEFVTGKVTRPEPTRALRTVLLTDIVGSTQRATAMGDEAWRAVLARHDELVDAAIAEHGGEVVKHLGDGVLATFDGPARAVRAGVAARDASNGLGLQLRVGVHCGEVELLDDDVAGVAVHVAARVEASAEADQVRVTSTVVDLTAGSGLVFDELGEHELKDLDRPWRLYAVRDA